MSNGLIRSVPSRTNKPGSRYFNFRSKDFTAAGLSFAYLGEYIKAEEAHLKSIQLDSNYLEAWLHLAQVLQVDNRVWKAYHFRGFVFHGLGEHRSPCEQKNVLIETENFDGEYRDAKGYLEVVRTLLSVGVSLKAITRKGLTPLPYAAQGSQLDLVKYLVKKGANVRATTKAGLVAVSQVRNILGLGTREAEAITVDVTSKAYRKRLAIHEGILGPPDLMLLQVTTKRDDSEYLLLNQLGGILGLISKEIVNIHVGLGVS
ncbi:unnamed protein product [Brassica oleracea]|uniref:(rape) hypothetical protein n=1 Tax=Brassica napus TaxID=3708 RepID=A0A816R560_BRANA|nr:unnamed protein product [Brassica napus]